MWEELVDLGGPTGNEFRQWYDRRLNAADPQSSNIITPDYFVDPNDDARVVASSHKDAADYSIQDIAKNSNTELRVTLPASSAAISRPSTVS